MGSFDDTLRRRKTHWAGGLVVVRGQQKTTMLAGYPCCCSGHLAEEIRAVGEYTRDRRYVTCKRCLRLMAKGQP